MADNSVPEAPVPGPSLTSTTTGQSIFIALWILGTLVALAVLVGSFLLGQYVASGSDNETPVVAEDTVQPEVEFPVFTGGPLEPGVWAWDELRGGECLSGYTGAFAEEYSVVDCTSPHDAQLVRAELLSSDPDALFPGDDAVSTEARLRCDVKDVIDYTVAAAYSDLIVDFAYPVSDEQWVEGQRGVYCFVFRSSGNALQESLIG